MSVRRIPASRRSATGVFATVKADVLIPYESTLEGDFLLAADFDESITAIEAQPLRVPYRAITGRRTAAVPDFLIHRFGQPHALCDIHPREQIVADWTRMRPRYVAVRDHAVKHGLRYYIRTEKHIRIDSLPNLRFLHPFLRRHPDQRDVFELCSHLSKKKLTIRELLERCARDVERQSELIPVIWNLIARKLLVVNLDKRLTMEVDIWLPNLSQNQQLQLMPSQTVRRG
ncbi:MAG: TnsA endonuclease N-terminal domain-containing protein [Vulcanimicrobiaceae bacterium]